MLPVHVFGIDPFCAAGVKSMPGMFYDKSGQFDMFFKTTTGSHILKVVPMEKYLKPNLELKQMIKITNGTLE